MILPTAWENVSPLFTAIGFHSSLARGKQINFLSANRNYAAKNQTGSGIYTSGGVLASWSSSSSSPSTRLITATVPVKPHKYNVDWTAFAIEKEKDVPSQNKTEEKIIFFDKYTVATGSQVLTISSMFFFLIPCL